MRRSIWACIIALAACLPAQAWSSWTQVGSSEFFVPYADRSTVRQNGSLSKIWALMDYKTANQLNDRKYLSSRMQFEFDCHEELSRVLYTSFHSGKMGRGLVVGIFTFEHGFDPVPPASVAALLWKAACPK